MFDEKTPVPLKEKEKSNKNCEFISSNYKTKPCEFYKKG